VARDVFGYDDAALADIAMAGVRASFADGDDKQRMLNDFAAWLADG
jgi:adenosine deaminase